MKRVILTRGLPGSGKTTWAKEELAQHPGQFKRINKDELRHMLDDGRHSLPNERFVLLVRNALILQALEGGHHVIVDDTNFHPKHEAAIRELVKGLAIVRIQDFTNVPLETCIARDLQRERSVGEHVIRQMYRQYVQPRPTPPVVDPTIPTCIMCDLDGTLALPNGRDPYDASKCEGDAINAPIANMLGRHFAIVLVSGRSEQHRPQTERWLNHHHVHYAALYMRPDGDNRKDA